MKQIAGRRGVAIWYGDKRVAMSAMSAALLNREKGGALRAQGFQRSVLTAAAEEVGIPGLHPHELRHTSASLAIASGATVKVVQQMLGHKSAMMTLDLYGHLFADQLDDVADALDAAASAARFAPLLPHPRIVNLDAKRRNATAPGIRGL